MASQGFATLSNLDMQQCPKIFCNFVQKVLAKNIDYLDFTRRAIFFSAILTVLFSLVFHDLSFGVTGRLSSFWDREHEPAIIGGLVIATSLAQQKISENKFNIKKCVFPIVIGGYCIILSRSRSVFLALFMVLVYLFSDKLKVKNVVALSILGIGAYAIFENFSQITHRALNYNLVARTSQYQLAVELIKEKPLFGIGVDKYGVLAGVTKVFTYNGLSTVTMDSTLLKYIVNLGLLFGLIYFLLLLNTYIYCRNTNRVYFLYIIFGLIIGLVTGKLGAYPMNQYFYPIIGYTLLMRDKNKSVKI